MGTPQKHIMIVAGEASGDMRAAGIVRALKNTGMRFSGVGGTHMADCGVELFANIHDLAVIGIGDVIKNFNRIKQIFDRVLQRIDKDRPDAVLLVDYPGFNLRLAREIKKRGIKVIYYVSPQVWAWQENRVKTIKTLVDRMLVLFPFEKDIYARYGMTVDYVGHPLVDEVILTQPPAGIRASLGFKPMEKIIGLMPGSRPQEIERHLPVMIGAAEILAQKDPAYRFLLLKAESIPATTIERHLRRSKVRVMVHDGPIYDGIGIMDLSIVASGTATLETGLLLKPMVIMYKTTPFTYWLGKMLIKLPFIGLVNVVAGKKVIEEFIQDKATPQNIATAVQKILSSPEAYGRLTNDLAAIKSSLGSPGASNRAAQIIQTELTK
ncbi:MAG TPA: lipid-A-disaccharide synthase [Candidatus Omnitrophota bacterium]|nr:lipid-A-disaccharide synthase [Candidatus Omnitrophota bacterium]